MNDFLNHELNKLNLEARNLKVRLVMIETQVDLCSAMPTLSLVNDTSQPLGEGVYRMVPIKAYWESQRTECLEKIASLERLGETYKVAA